MTAVPPSVTSSVTLTIPADVRFLRVARLVVAGLGADADLTVDDIDDLRVAVDEVGAVMIDVDGDATLELEFETSADRLGVHARRSGVQQLPEIHPVSRALLDATTHGFEMRLADDGLEVDAWRRSGPRT